MEDINFLQFFLYMLPAVVVGLVAFYFFNMHLKAEEQRRKFLLHRENKKIAFPVRMQAYERMALFLERISPGNLLIRIKPHSEDKESYVNHLSRTIEQEFEHNLAQQIYISEECWNVIKASKNATVNNIRKTAAQENVQTAADLRQNILTNLLDQASPSDTGMAFLKKEISSLW